MMVSKYNTSEARFDVSKARLQVQCGRGIDSASFRNLLLDALSFAGEHRVKHWLLDLRPIGELSADDEAWVYTQLFPGMMMTLGAENYLAVLISETCYRRLLHEAGWPGLVSFNSFIILQLFYKPEAAEAWLSEHRPCAA